LILFFALSNEMVSSWIVSWMWLVTALNELWLSVMHPSKLQSYSGNMSDRPFLMG
jgi:hypothetical protein